MTSWKNQVHAIGAAPLSQGWKDTQAGAEPLSQEKSPAYRGHLTSLDWDHPGSLLYLQEDQEGAWLTAQATAACSISQHCGCVTLGKLIDLTEPPLPPRLPPSSVE